MNARLEAFARHGFWALPLAWYWWTACPGVGWVDAGMLVDNVWHLKLGAAANSHDLFLILGRIWLEVFPVGAPAYRLNLLCGLLGALTVHFLFRTAWLLTGDLLAAAVGGLALTLSHSLWWHSTMIEVYTLNTALLGQILFRVVRWERDRALADLYVALFCFGLGVVNHPLMGLFGASFLALFAVPSLRDALWRPRVVLGGVATFLVAAQVYLVQVLNAYTVELAKRPWGEGARWAALHQVAVDATGGKFLDNMFSTDVNHAAWYQNWLFLWVYQYPSVAWLLGLVGLVAWARDRERRGSFVFFAVGLAVQALWSSNYFVWDMYAFGLPVWVLWGLLVGPGLHEVARWGPRARAAAFASLPTLLIGPLLYPRIATFEHLPPFFGLNVYRGASLYDSVEFLFDPDKRGYTRAEDIVSGYVATLPPNAQIWDSDGKGAYPFKLYGQRVLGLRPDVNLHFVYGAFPDDDEAKPVLKALDSGQPVFFSAVTRPERRVLTRLERLVDPDAPKDLDQLSVDAFVAQYPLVLEAVPLVGVDDAVIYRVSRR